MIAWTDEPVRDAERYQNYLEEHQTEEPDDDQYKTLCAIYEARNKYLRRLNEESNKDSTGVESTEK